MLESTKVPTAVATAAILKQCDACMALPLYLLVGGNFHLGGGFSEILDGVRRSLTRSIDGQSIVIVYVNNVKPHTHTHTHTTHTHTHIYIYIYIYIYIQRERERRD